MNPDPETLSQRDERLRSLIAETARVTLGAAEDKGAWLNPDHSEGRRDVARRLAVSVSHKSCKRKADAGQRGDRLEKEGPPVTRPANRLL